MDVWKADPEGRLDIRMSRQFYESLGWEECSVLHESVEELVVKFEKQLLNKTDAEWFEEYVSQAILSIFKYLESSVKILKLLY